MGASLEDLPSTVLLHILSYLPAHDLVHTVPQVCSQWASLCFDRDVWLSKQYVVGPDGDRENDLELAATLSRLPGCPRHLVLLRPVRRALLDSVGGDCVESLSFHHQQQLSVQELEELLRRCSNITDLQLPIRLIKRREVQDVLLNTIAGRLQKLAVTSEHWGLVLNVDKLVHHLPQLRVLNVCQVSCQPDGLRDLISACAQLRELAFHGTTHDGKSLLPIVIPHCQQLDKLEVWFDGARASQLKGTITCLGQLTRLKELVLENVPGKEPHIKDAFTENGLRELRSLALRKFSALSGETLATVLRDRPKLKHLDISRSTWIDDTVITEGLCSREPEPLPLVTLNLSFSRRLFGESIRQVAKNCPQLRELHLTACHMLLDNSLDPVGTLADLRVLDISRCYKLKGWWKPLFQLQQIRWLDLSYLDSRSMSLEQLVTHQKHLKYLGLRYCCGVNQMLCERLKSINPNLHIDFEYLPTYVN